LTQAPGAPVAVSGAAAAGGVMQSGLPTGPPPLTPGNSQLPVAIKRVTLWSTMTLLPIFMPLETGMNILQFTYLMS